ncbi:EAL domain-containing protein [Xanthobacter sp. VNH20]|uniref:putative bifunctional diguanylate cyclase/phosphodiesterase n=1 Tax=Xanthobacter sp. VNH20 TaxID=3156616 RepID=UPI0032B5DBAA
MPLILVGPAFGLAATGGAAALVVVGAALVPGVLDSAWEAASAALALAAGAAVVLGAGWRLASDPPLARSTGWSVLLLLAVVAPVILLLPRAAGAATSLAAHNVVMQSVMMPAATLALGGVLVFAQHRWALHAVLAESHERFAAIAANIPGVFYERRLGSGQKLAFTYVSDRAQEILGVSARAMLADPNAFLRVVHPSDLPLVLSAIERSSAPGAGAVVTEYRVVRPDGAVRWIQTHTQINATITRPGESVADGIAFDITDRKEAELAAARATERVAWLGDHDQMTGLPNRTALRAAASRALSRDAGGHVGLILVDLRDSRFINELFGHEAGDARIIDAACRIVAAAPKDAVVARTGSDEFGILWTGVSGAGEAGDGEAIAGPRPEDPDGQALDTAMRALGERVLEKFHRPFVIEGQPVPMVAYMGYAIGPGDATEESRLFQAAAIALQAARDSQRSAPARFTTAIERERNERRLFDQDLAAAIEAGHIRLVWQPVVASGDRRLIGHEALARWYRPGHGEIAPSVFVARAETSGQWAKLDRFVLRAACREAATWALPCWVSVNVSAAWFRFGDLPTLVENVLAETGLDPGRLRLEVTEGVLIEEHDEAVSTFERLHALGVGVVIDDFGAFYSSLGYLHRLPIRKIKLDRSFIANVETDQRSRIIVSTILQLCQTLNIYVVAEGVESEGQLVWLAEQGCPAVQGYLTGRPAPLAACPAEACLITTCARSGQEHS